MPDLYFLRQGASRDGVDVFFDVRGQFWNCKSTWLKWRRKASMRTVVGWMRPHRRHLSVSVLRSRAELAAWRSAQEGRDVGLVPTMGALHDGHGELMGRAVRENDAVIASIFVNPTQFAAGEDLERYPRTFAEDLAMLERRGVVACFAPSVREMYGDDDGFRVSPPRRFDSLSEGAARPGHFSGVCTVVSKLWNGARPTRSYFGQKDAMQCAVVRQLQRDLHFDLEVVVCDTARHADGLAMSSRNAYLSDAERRAAPVVNAALEAARDAWLQQAPLEGGQDARQLLDAAKRVLGAEPLVRTVEYVSVADYDTMAELDAVDPPDPGGGDPKAILSLAVKLGDVRLIDNCPLKS